jgi:hypothetical protein
MKRSFHVRTVLSVTTGRLLTIPDGRGNGIGDMYELLDHMTGDSVYTHQLGRFSDECKPWLYRWFPELKRAEASLPWFDTLMTVSETEQAIDFWVAQLGLPAGYEVGTIPADDHERKDPYDELVAMRGTDEGIIILGNEDQL